MSEITIRPFAEGDLELEQRLLGDPAMTLYLGGPETPEQIQRRYEKFLEMNYSDEGRVFVVQVGADKVAAGTVGYWEREWQGQTVWEMGWSVLPEFQGQGIATAAIIALLEQMRTVGQHRFVHAYPSVENGPSNAVCRKAGFTLGGVVEGEYPAGHLMRCNDWYVDMTNGMAATTPLSFSRLFRN